jgi:hypothetical protein
MEEKLLAWLRQGGCPPEVLPARADDIKLLLSGSKEARQAFDVLVRRGSFGTKAQGLRSIHAFLNALEVQDVGDERKNLIQRRFELVRQLSELKETQTRLLTDCRRLQKDVEKGATAYRERRVCCDDRREGLMLLRVYRRKLESQAALFGEYARRLLKGVDMGNEQVGNPANLDKDCSVVASLCEGIVGKECALGAGGLDTATAQSVSRQVRLQSACDNFAAALL